MNCLETGENTSETDHLPRCYSVILVDVLGVLKFEPKSFDQVHTVVSPLGLKWFLWSKFKVENHCPQQTFLIICSLCLVKQEIQRQLRLQSCKQSARSTTSREQRVTSASVPPLSTQPPLSSSSSSSSTSSSSHHQHQPHHPNKSTPGELLSQCVNIKQEPNTSPEGVAEGPNNSQTACAYYPTPAQHGYKPRCRTGWPQHVWALELKNYDQ